jgi:hypothetical protein
LLYVGLHKTVNSNRETINNLFQIILSNGFPRLRICTALDIGTLSFSNTWTGSPALRTLNLVMKTKSDYDQLHSICPHLHRLTTHNSSIDDTQIGTSFLFVTLGKSMSASESIYLIMLSILTFLNKYNAWYKKWLMFFARILSEGYTTSKFVFWCKLDVVIYFSTLRQRFSTYFSWASTARTIRIRE